MSAKPMKLTSLTGVGYGQKANVKIPFGPTYEEIILSTNLTAAQLKRITVTLNADEIYILDGEELLMLEAYKEHTPQAGKFVIPFSDISGKTKNGIRATGLVTEFGDNIMLDVEIADVSDPSDAPAIKLDAHAMVSEGQERRVVIPKIRKQTMQASAEGENEFTQLTHGANIKVRRMHFKSDKVTGLKIYRNNKKEYEADRSLAKFLAKRNDRTFQNGIFHFDPIQRGFFIDELFETYHTEELKFTAITDAVAGSIPILVESIEVVPLKSMA